GPRVGKARVVATAILIANAKVAVDVAAVGRLANEHAGERVRRAQAAAASAAAVANGSVDGRRAAPRGARLRDGASSERRRRGLVADTAAAVGCARANVSRLDAV